MQEKSIIKQNILKYLDFKGISPYKFYQDSGITRGILSQNNGMSEENTTKFLAYSPDVNIEWLLTGEGSMLKSDVPSLNVIETINFKDLADARLQIIELKDEKIARLEKDLSELRYTQKERFLYQNVAEPAPELIGKKNK